MAFHLNRLEAHAREVLEAEARRRSIRNPEFRTRGELIRLILKHQYGDQLSTFREQVGKGVRNLALARNIVTTALSSLPGGANSASRAPPPIVARPMPRAEAAAAPSTREAEALLDKSDCLHCEGQPHTGVRFSWQVTEDGLRRARTVLGGEGELAVRVVSVTPDAAYVVRSEITEHGPVSPCDVWAAPPFPESARCVAAIGLRHGDRFVAIAHRQI